MSTADHVPPPAEPDAALMERLQGAFPAESTYQRMLSWYSPDERPMDPIDRLGDLSPFNFDLHLRLLPTPGNGRADLATTYLDRREAHHRSLFKRLLPAVDQMREVWVLRDDGATEID